MPAKKKQIKQANRSNQKNSSKLKKLVEALVPNSRFKQVLIFVFAFGIIGGSYMLYQSFAASTIKLVYEFDGHLYSVLSDGTNKVNISTTSGYDDDANQHGNKLVFSSLDIYGSPAEFHRNIFTMTTNGKNRVRLTTNALKTSDQFPHWNSAGTEIVYTRYQPDGSSKLRIVNADGTNDHAIGTQSSGFLYVSWVPGSEQIVYSILVSGAFNMYLVNSDGTGQVRLGTGSVETVTTGNPHRLIFADAGQLKAMNLDKSNVKILVPYSTDAVAFLCRNDRAWNGSKLLYVTSSGASTTAGVQKLWSMNLDGSQKTDMLNVNGPDILQCSWSQDGTQIAIATQTTSNNVGGLLKNILVMNADGSAITKVFSSDGTRGGNLQSW